MHFELVRRRHSSTRIQEDIIELSPENKRKVKAIINGLLIATPTSLIDFTQKEH